MTLSLPPKVQKKIKHRPGYGDPPKRKEGPGSVKTYGKNMVLADLLPGTYRLPKAGASVKVPKPVVLPIAISQAKLGIPSRFIIEGKRATDLEWRVWRTLLKLGWPQSEIDFQTNILGGHMPGGIILDFVVWTPGMVTIIEPSGDFWHIHTPQQMEHDRLRIAALQQVWTRPFRYFSLASGDLVTDEQAYHNLMLKVGRF